MLKVHKKSGKILRDTKMITVAAEDNRARTIYSVCFWGLEKEERTSFLWQRSQAWPVLRGVGGWAQPAPLGVWGGEREGRKTGGERRRGGVLSPLRGSGTWAFHARTHTQALGKGPEWREASVQGSARGPWHVARGRPGVSEQPLSRGRFLSTVQPAALTGRAMVWLMGSLGPSVAKELV